MIRAIVVGVCLVSAGIIAVYTHYSRGGGEPVYTVPARAPDPAPSPPVPAAATRPVDPTDRVALARALQRELKRVGCYSGEVTGVWTTSSRMAMKTFNERVNATLPVDNPDPVLLSLVQGRRERACAVGCPPGQTAAEGGACVPAAVAAKPGEAAPGAAAAASGTAAAVAMAAPGAAKPDPRGGDPKGLAPETKPPVRPASPRAAAGGPNAGTGSITGPITGPTTGPIAGPSVGPAGEGGPSGGPVPPEGMARDRKPRRSAEAPPPRPPKIVRDVLRALGF